MRACVCARVCACGLDYPSACVWGGGGGEGTYTLLVVVQQLAFRAGILPIDVH
jgi:hypothetical protein